MGDPRETFGNMLRATRVAHGYSLRKFAELIDVSPTYLSQIEQGKTQTPPTIERLRKMAEVLDENAEEWIIRAGRLPEELADIIQREPVAMSALIRAADGQSAERVQNAARDLGRRRRS